METTKARTNVIEILVDGWGVRPKDAAEMADAICDCLFRPIVKQPDPCPDEYADD